MKIRKRVLLEDKTFVTTHILFLLFCTLQQSEWTVLKVTVINMKKARAGEIVPVLKESKEKPAWVELVKTYLVLKKSQDIKSKNELNNEINKNFSGLYGLALQRLSELKDYENSDSKIIRFPLVFSKLCRNFSMNKHEVWNLLFFLKDMGIIQIVPYQGVKLNF